MGRASKTELEWAFLVTHERILKQLYEKGTIPMEEWERHNNPDFDEKAFEQLLIDARSPSYTLTPKKWINTVSAIGMSSRRGKNGGTEAHPFIACDFEMWLDASFRYEVLKYFMSSKIEKDDI